MSAAKRSAKKADLDHEDNEEVIVKKQKNNQGNELAATPKKGLSSSKVSTKTKSPQSDYKFTPKIDDLVSDDDDDDEDDTRVAPKTKPATSKKTKSKKIAPKDPTLEVVVKGMPFKETEKEIKQFFGKVGKIENIDLLKDLNGRSKGMAFLKFGDVETLKKAVALANSQYKGRTIKVEKALPKSDRPSSVPQDKKLPKDKVDPASPNVFVGNLSYNTTEDTLRKAFKSCGDIKELRLALNSDGKPRGFAHVEFASVDSAKLAVEKSGSIVDGRPIKVDFARPQKDLDTKQKSKSATSSAKKTNNQTASGKKSNKAKEVSN